MSDTKVWTIEVDIEETENETTAVARLEIAGDHYGGWGRAKRNPADPDVPRIGEELACARALNDLAHRLLDWVTEEIEEFEPGAERAHL